MRGRVFGDSRIKSGTMTGYLRAASGDQLVRSASGVPRAVADQMGKLFRRPWLVVEASEECLLQCRIKVEIRDPQGVVVAPQDAVPTDDEMRLAASVAPNRRV